MTINTIPCDHNNRTEKDYGYEKCENPDNCNPSSHGSRCIEQACLVCGRRRRINVSFGRREVGTWNLLPHAVWLIVNFNPYSGVLRNERRRFERTLNELGFRAIDRSTWMGLAAGPTDKEKFLDRIRNARPKDIRVSVMHLPDASYADTVVFYPEGKEVSA